MIKKSIRCILLLCLTLVATASLAQRSQKPLMGWASWNAYRNEISEDLIKSQADALIELGLDKYGYTYLNIDDGYFGGRDQDGNLISHPTKFPSGMKSIADYIHSKGLKAGIYTDAGINSCTSYWDSDPNGVGIGLFGNERRDLTLMLNDWGYDFVKVDWCGGDWMELDEQIRYTEIGNIIRELKPEAVYNVCRWKFPGNWVVGVADSWRVSPDIAESFGSVMSIVDQNADLWKFSGPGHVNDMDILQVGRGMTYEEDKTHFSMWCILNSPLIAGNDLTKVSEQTISILKNEELIALNQDPLVYQARKMKDEGELEIWAKPLKSTLSGEVAVVLLNRSNASSKITFELKDVGISSSVGYTYRELWAKKDFPESTQFTQTFDVPSHGVIVLKIKGKSQDNNVFQFAKDHPMVNNPKFK